MSKIVRFHPEAEDELRAAAEWYDDRAALGDEFAAEVLTTTQWITKAPESFPAWHTSGASQDTGARGSRAGPGPDRLDCE